MRQASLLGGLSGERAVTRTGEDGEMDQSLHPREEYQSFPVSARYCSASCAILHDGLLRRMDGAVGSLFGRCIPKRPVVLCVSVSIPSSPFWRGFPLFTVILTQIYYHVKYKKSNQNNRNSLLIFELPLRYNEIKGE